jgi:hypothetical protein
MDTITIDGPQGSFEVCAGSGHIVTPYSKIPRPYRGYSRADTDELRTWAEKANVSITPSVSILCVTLYKFGGGVHKALEEYREEVAIAAMEARLFSTAA